MLMNSAIATVRWLALLVGLVCAPAFAQTATQSPDDKLDAIMKRFEEQLDKAYDAQNAAKTDEAHAAAKKLMPGKEYVQELRDLATSARGTDAAAGAWLAIIQIAGRVDDAPGAKQALDVLLDEYIESPKLEGLPSRLRYAGPSAGADVVNNALRKMIEKSPHATVRASALYTQASILLGDGKTAEAKSAFNRLGLEYGDVKTMRGSTYGAVAEQNLFELDKLQVGMVAPDFDVVDENGAAFKLSDYRGKVVIVDFWGFW